MNVEMNATSSEIARAVDHAGEHVAAALVDAEPVVGGGPGRRAEVVEQVGFCTFGSGAPVTLTISGSEDRHEAREHHEAGRDHRDLVLPEPPPEQLQRRTCCDLLTRDKTRFLGRVFLVTKQLGGARAHARASGAWMNCLN